MLDCALRVSGEFRCNTRLPAAERAGVITTTIVPELGFVAYRTEDLYRADDVPHGLLYMRHVGVLRLARILEDQLGLGEDDALVLSVELSSVDEHEA